MTDEQALIQRPTMPLWLWFALLAIVASIGLGIGTSVGKQSAPRGTGGAQGTGGGATGGGP